MDGLTVWFYGLSDGLRYAIESVLCGGTLTGACVWFGILSPKARAERAMLEAGKGESGHLFGRGK